MEEQAVQSLPQSVKDILFSDFDVETNRNIRSDFYLTDDQYNFTRELIMNIILKKYDVLDLPKRLAKMPNPEFLDLQKLALRIATDKLWPYQSHLGRVDVLIRRLGGTVPEKHSQISQAQGGGTPVDLEQGKAEDMLRKHPEYNELYLTQKPVKDDDDRLKSPSVKNWLADYLHTMGASGASSLKRSQFLAKSRNAVKLNESEKENLLNFFISYEEGTEMYWEVAEEQYLIVKSELQTEEAHVSEKEEAEHTLDSLLAYYKDTQKNYTKLFTDQKQGLDVELSGDTKKLYDIIWDALGLGEIERCLSALDYLVQKGIFLDMVKTDRRYRGIVNRYIDAGYGSEAKKYWTNDLSSIIGLVVFFKVVLVEKLKIEESRAAVLADIWVKRIGLKISPLYLDLKKGKFLFREIRYVDHTFRFA